jgi:hypothetical protein
MRRVSLVLLVIGLLASGSVFSLATAGLVSDAYRDFEAGNLARTDFRGFYFGAETITSENHSLTYDRESMIRGILAAANLDESQFPEEKRSWLVYYNPPAFLLALSPLTLLERSDAYLVSIAVNLVVAAVLAYCLGKMLSWRQPHSTLLILAMFSFLPTYSTIYHSQPTLFVALILAAAFLASERGRGIVGCILLSFAVAKPHWMVLSGVSLLRNRPRLFTPLIAAFGVVTFLPFVFLGSRVLLEYVDLLQGRSAVDLETEPFASRLLNWSGFFTHLTGSGQPIAAVMASLLTMVLFGVVLRRGDRHLTWAAAILTTVLVTPHLHPQDWVAALPGAAFLLSRPMNSRNLAVTSGLLLVVFWGVNAAGFVGVLHFAHTTIIPWAVPAAFALLIWCAALPIIEDRQTDTRRRHSTVPNAESLSIA